MPGICKVYGPPKYSPIRSVYGSASNENRWTWTDSSNHTSRYYTTIIGALSNGEADFLAHLAANRIVPVEEVGTFKPHPFTELTEALLCSRPYRSAILPLFRERAL